MERVIRMFRRLTHTDPMWENPPYQAEEVLFNLFYRLRNAEEGLFFADDAGRAVLARTDPAHAAWIWTHPECTEAELEALRMLLKEHEITRITARAGIAERLFPGGKVRERLLGNYCPQLIPATPVDGGASLAKEEDIETLALMIVGFSRHTQDPDLTLQEGRKTAAALISAGELHLWRNGEGQIVSCARIQQRSPRYTTINFVYTLPEQRGKGYVPALLAGLCEGIFAQGLTPLLYTDASYPSSNRAYRKIGFVPVGELVMMEA